MTLPGTFLRRHFEPLILSTQVLVDLVVVLAACCVGWWLRESGSASEYASQLPVYREVFALTAAVCLVSFHAFGLYSPRKSLLNIEEFKAIAKSTTTAFLVVITLIVMLTRTEQTSAEFPYTVLRTVHGFVDLDPNPSRYARLVIVFSFALIFLFMMVSRFISFKLIQGLHRRGIGNLNVLIYGANDVGRKLQQKFLIVPTLGLNLVGFVDEDDSRVGTDIEGTPIVGGFGDLDRVAGIRKVSQVFVALPDAPEEEILEVIAEIERCGMRYHVVPRFYHLLSYKMRLETLDSIPLITQPDRFVPLPTRIGKRLIDLVFSTLVLTLGGPFFFVIGMIIKRESEGPVFFRQTRIGKDGKPFTMYKFRTMHAHMSGDAPAPSAKDDPRITRIGRWLRRTSLDELPQFINVFKGEMSVVGPRPEMRFIVEKYNALERERLRAKPGITGLWQISYARRLDIHENLDYDLYYIENESVLLDLVIIPLTVVAVVKGTGAY